MDCIHWMPNCAELAVQLAWGWWVAARCPSRMDQGRAFSGFSERRQGVVGGKSDGPPRQKCTRTNTTLLAIGAVKLGGGLMKRKDLGVKWLRCVEETFVREPNSGRERARPKLRSGCVWN